MARRCSILCFFIVLACSLQRAESISRKLDQDPKKDAEKRLLDAAKDESHETSTAKAAAEQVALTSSKNVDELLEQTRQDIGKRSDEINRTISNLREKAAKQATESAQKQMGILENTRASLKSTKDFLVEAATPSEIVKATFQSRDASRDAIKQAELMTTIAREAMDGITASAEAMRLAAQKGLEGIRNVASDAQKKADDMANSVAHLGQETASKMKATEVGEEIASACNGAASKMKEKTNIFMDEMSKDADALERTTEEEADRIIVAASNAKAMDLAAAQRLSEAAKRAIDVHDEAQTVWREKNAIAVQKVGEYFVSSDVNTPKSNPHLSTDANIVTQKNLTAFFSIVILLVACALVAVMNSDRK